MTTHAIALSAAQVEFLQGNVVIYAASTDGNCQTNIARVAGCRIDGNDRVTIFVAAASAAALLADVRDNGALAVVFCQPHTEKAVQLKSCDAQVVALTRDDYYLMSDYQQRIVNQILPVGFAPEMLRSFFAPPRSDAVAICFTPYAAFDQTPGPNAGILLEAAAPC